MSESDPPGGPPVLPVPVMALPYSMPMRSGRPGVLTAVGVISIVVACLSAMANLGTALYGIGFFALSRASAAFSGGTTTTTTVTASPGSATVYSYSVAAPGTAAGAGPAATGPGQQAPAAVPDATAAAPPDKAAGASDGDTGDTGAAASPAAAGASAPPALTPAEIETAITKVQQQCANGLNAAQLSALRAELQARGPQLITPGTAWSPVQSATIAADGSAFVTFTAGWVSISPQGAITSSAASPVTPAMGPGFPPFRVSPLPCALVVGDAVLSEGLAVLLFVAGIQVVRQSLSGRRLHLMYAWLKIPLALGGGASIAWMFAQFTSGIAAATGGGAAGAAGAVAAVFFAWGVVIALAGCAYPVALLIVMHTRAVRDYYNSAQA